MGLYFKDTKVIIVITLREESNMLACIHTVLIVYVVKIDGKQPDIHSIVIKYSVTVWQFQDSVTNQTHSFFNSDNNFLKCGAHLS